VTFDAIGGFVSAKSLALDSGMAGVFNRLRVNDHPRCPGSFF
jgi:hypothetical protein